MKKRETVLVDTLESKIVGMYGLGMSFRDISSHLKEMYDADIYGKPSPLSAHVSHIPTSSIIITDTVHFTDPLE